MADIYRGTFAVRQAASQHAGDSPAVETIAFELAVSEALAKESGDHELWRHSRLRWLDSTVGEVSKNETGAVNECANGVDCVVVSRRHSGVVLTAPGGRHIALSPSGLPSSLRVGNTELLASAMRLRLVLQGDSSDLRLELRQPVKIERATDGSIGWVAVMGAAALQARVSGSLDSDGLAEMSVELSATEAGTDGAPPPLIGDVRLQLPLVASQVPMMNGFDIKGGRRPEDVQWRWDAEKPDKDHAQRGLNCRVWLGSAVAGLQLNLQGAEQAAAAAASSCGNDENGQLQCENLSDAQFNVALGSREWFNSNRGGASVVTSASHQAAGERTAVLTVYTGRLEPLKPGGAPLRLHWRLLLTPVRGSGAPQRADFATRYFHMQRFVPVAKALETSRENCDSNTT